MDKYSSNRHKKNSQYTKKIINHKNKSNNFNQKVKLHKFSSNLHERRSMNKRKLIKSIIIVSLSALFIGLSFGFIMLNLIQSDQSIDEHGLINTNELKTVDNQTTEKKQITIPTLTAYTVQLGVFSKESNAKEFVDTLKLSTDEVMIWSRESSYYVLGSIANSSKDIKPMLKKIQKISSDSFKKLWETDEFNITTTEENIEQWIDQFIETWNHSVKNSSQFQSEQWELLLNEKLSNDSFSELNQSIQELVELDPKDNLQLQQKLLILWFQFENLLFTLEEN